MNEHTPDTPPVTDYQVERLLSQIAFLTRDGDAWRTVLTDSESADGIALRCTSPDHPADDRLQQWGVYDCCDFRVIETPHEKFAAFFVSALAAIPALLAERDELRATVAGLHDEYGILRYQENALEPNPLPAENAALAVELRPRGVFGPGTVRPGTLMRRKATDWEEIPDDVTPDDILPGYSARKAAAAREAQD